MIKVLFYLAIFLPPMYLYHYMNMESFKKCDIICESSVESCSIFQCKCKE